MAGSTILGIVYGLDAQPVHDPYIRVVEEAVQIGAEVASAGTFYIGALRLSGTPMSTNIVSMD